MRDAALPDGATPTLGPLSTPIGELFRYTLQGPENFNEIQLRELQDWVIAPRLLQVPGVADVVPFGGLVKQYQIEIDPLKLEKYNFTVSKVGQAVGANNRNAGGAMIDNRQQSMVVRGVGLIGSTADIENIVLSAVAGVPVFLEDVARVQVGAALQALGYTVTGTTTIPVMGRPSESVIYYAPGQQAKGERNEDHLGTHRPTF